MKNSHRGVICLAVLTSCFLLTGRHDAQAAQKNELLPDEAPSWWKEMPLTTPEGELSRALSGWLKRDLPPPLRNTLYDSMERAIEKADNGTRLTLASLIAPLYMNDVLGRRNIVQAKEFLRNQDVTLSRAMPFETALWKMQVAILEGDGDAAGQALTEAVLARPAYSNSVEYTKQQATIFKLNASTIMPLSLEQTPQSVREAVETMTRNHETNRLCLYLRDVLRLRNDATIASSDDPSLFIGAKPYYRRELAAYAPLYEPWLSREIANLSQQPNRQADAARLNRIARLSPPANRAVTTPEFPSASAPIPDGFTPLIDGMPGTVEVTENHLRYLMTQQPSTEPPVTFCAEDGLVWLANSRMLTRLTAGRVAWTWAAPLQQMATSDSARNGGATRPAVAGNIVAISALLRSASLAVIGLDRDTGATRWSWINRLEEVASDPVAWGTNRVVVMQSSSSRDWINLVILDAATGKVTLVLPLSSSPTPRENIQAGSTTFNRASSWKVPAPRIEGDVAYVSTSMGMVAAVNLADESLLWMRNYTRFKDIRLIGLRSVRSPLVGRTTVLFAPWDSSSLLLADKATGKLIASRMDIPWHDVVPCGPDHALILAGPTTYLLSLTDLSERKVLTGQAYRVIQVVREGCLVSEPDRSVSLIRPDGSITAISPASPDQQLLGCGADGVWYAASGPGYQWCGIRKPPPPLPSLIHPQRKVASNGNFTEGMLVATNTTLSLVRCGQILAAISNQGEPLWELPTPGNNQGILSIKGRVILAHSGHLWIHDEHTGELIRTMPGIMAVFPSAGGFGYAIGRDANTLLGLWNLDADGVITTPAIARLDERVSSTDFKDFSVITGPSHISIIYVNDPYINRSAIWSAPRKPAPAILAPIDAPPFYHAWVPGDGAKGATLTDQGKLFIVDASGVHAKTTAFLPGKNNFRALDGTRTSGELIEARRDGGRLEYLNPMSGHIFDPKTLSLRYPAALGTRIYGLKFTAGSDDTARPEKIEPLIYAVDGSEKSTVGPSLPDWVNELTWSDPHYGWQSSAIANGMESVLLLAPPLDYMAEHNWRFWRGRKFDMPPLPRDDGVAILWNGDTFKSALRLPNIPRGSRIWSTPQGVVNIGGTWMSESQWQRALHLRESAKICNSPAGIETVDGFLDDWPTNEFFAIPYGSMAMRINSPGELSIAVMITHTGLVERLGTVGLDHRLDLSVLPENEIFFGEAPSAFPKLDLAQGVLTEYYLKDLGSVKNTKSVRFAWTVRPDGKTCQIEALVTGLPLNPSPAETSGYIGTRLLWYPSPAEKPLNLVGDMSFGPLSYVNAKFR